MGIVTLAGPSLAKVGAVFRYAGSADECEECGLKAVCHKLKPGYRYEVTAVRDVEHPCQVHSGATVTVVEVEELPVEAAIPSRTALEAALVTLDEPECPRKWCPNHALCTVAEDLKGGKVAVKEIKGQLECPRGLKLKKVIVEPRRENG
jgi:hypothetical protein